MTAEGSNAQSGGKGGGDGKGHSADNRRDGAGKGKKGRGGRGKGWIGHRGQGGRGGKAPAAEAHAGGNDQANPLRHSIRKNATLDPVHMAVEEAFQDTGSAIMMSSSVEKLFQSAREAGQLREAAQARESAGPTAAVAAMNGNAAMAAEIKSLLRMDGGAEAPVAADACAGGQAAAPARLAPSHGSGAAPRESSGSPHGLQLKWQPLNADGQRRPRRREVDGGGRSGDMHMAQPPLADAPPHAAPGTTVAEPPTQHQDVGLSAEGHGQQQKLQYLQQQQHSQQQQYQQQQQQPQQQQRQQQQQLQQQHHHQQQPRFSQQARREPHDRAPHAQGRGAGRGDRRGYSSRGASHREQSAMPDAAPPATSARERPPADVKQLAQPNSFDLLRAEVLQGQSGRWGDEGSASSDTSEPPPVPSAAPSQPPPAAPSQQPRPYQQRDAQFGRTRGPQGPMPPNLPASQPLQWRQDQQQHHQINLHEQQQHRQQQQQQQQQQNRQSQQHPRQQGVGATAGQKGRPARGPRDGPQPAKESEALANGVRVHEQAEARASGHASGGDEAAGHAAAGAGAAAVVESEEARAEREAAAAARKAAAAEKAAEKAAAKRAAAEKAAAKRAEKAAAAAKAAEEKKAAAEAAAAEAAARAVAEAAEREAKARAKAKAEAEAAVAKRQEELQKKLSKAGTAFAALLMDDESDDGSDDESVEAPTPTRAAPTHKGKPRAASPAQPSGSAKSAAVAKPMPSAAQSEAVSETRAGAGAGAGAEATDATGATDATDSARIAADAGEAQQAETEAAPAEPEPPTVFWGSEEHDEAQRKPLALTSAVYCKKGEHKLHANEDRYMMASDLNAELEQKTGKAVEGPPGSVPPTNAYFAVFDGHGGSECATQASHRLHLLLPRDERLWREHPEAALLGAFEGMEAELREGYVHSHDKSGTCALTVLIRGHRLFIGGLGDCRAIVVRGDNNSPWQQLTTDQRATSPNEQRRILKSGGSIVDGRVWGALIPSRTLGDFPWKDKGPALSSEPEITKYAVAPEDRYLVLGSDGLFDVLSNKMIARLIGNKTASAQKACNELVKELKKKHGKDDVTVIVVQLNET